MSGLPAPPNGLSEEALRIVRTRYPDFGSTLAHEKLREVHGLRMSVETLRKAGVSRVNAKSPKAGDQPDA